MQNPIQMIDETTFSTEARCVSYYLRLDILGRWEVTSQRLALRAARMGGTVRHFASLAEVSENISAFRGINLLVEG
jgi:hypothetical protein